MSAPAAPRVEPGFEFVEGATSDLSFAARGGTLEQVFSAAADALLAATVESPAAVADRVTRQVSLSDTALDLLLLRFLNELIYLRDAHGLLLRARELRIDRDPSPRLEAVLAGETLDRARHGAASDVKAATAHGLGVEPLPGGGWRATVTLDV
jgi:SHS2 domain-containing protein